MAYVYFQLGFHHLTEPGAWDHQLFLLTIALAYAPDRWRRWLLLATVFALGHTAAIVALTLGIVPEGMAWVEPGILVSLIAMAALEWWALRQNPFGMARGITGESLGLAAKPQTLTVLAGVFGVVHGLGFGASFLAVVAPGASGGELAAALLAFTLGVEAAQVLILAGLWVLAFAVFSLYQWRPLLLRRALLAGVALVATVKLVVA